MAYLQMTPDERKLQPVFDDISEGRYKVAEKTITNHLKKAPNSSTAQVARLVLQLAQNAPAETWQKTLGVIRRVSGLSPSNLWRTERALKEIGRWDLIMALHQDMVTRNPSNEDFQAHLHLAAVGCWNVEVMASSARQVFNLTKDLTWARRAAWAEWVKNAPQPTRQQPFPPPAPAGSLKIAQITLGMTRRDMAPTSDVLWLHLQVLLSAGENKQAHVLLMTHGQGGGLARDWYRMQGVQDIAKRERESGNGDATWVWQQELDRWLDVWTKDTLAQRNYAYYRHSILAAKALAPHHPKLVTKLRDALVALDQSIGDKERAPRLARLELENELDSDDDVMPVETWQELVLGYWTRWGSKGSVVPELEGIAGKHQQRMLEIMAERKVGGHSDEQSYREVVNATLYSLRSHPTSWEPTTETIKECWTLYNEGLVYGKNLTDKDVQPADRIGLAAVQLILSKEKDTEATLRAIVCLEWILKHSPACAHARFLLVRLYRLIGAPGIASRHLQELAPSEIQLDTLMHISIDGSATDALIEESSEAWAENAARMRKMYNSTTASLPDQIEKAVTTEAYSKIHSIRELLESQRQSRTRASLELETRRRSSVSGSRTAGSAITATKADELVDTRNWELMPDIGGNRLPIKDMPHLRLPDDSPDALVCKLAVERAVAAFCAGENQEAELPIVDKAKFSQVDGIHYALLRTVLERALGKNETPVDLDESILELPLGGSRWSALDAVAQTHELLTQLRAISARVQAGAKRKEKPPLVNELAKAVDTLQHGLAKMVEQVNAQGAECAQLDWSRVASGLIEDEAFVDGIASEVKAAQSRKIKLSSSA